MPNMMEAMIWTITRTGEGNMVLLKLRDAEIGIPIFVDKLETRSILAGYSEKTPPRPGIHDLFLELVQRLGLALFRIEVYTIKNNIFYGRVLFSGKDYDEKNPLILNARPGDLFALAARSKCSIYVSRKVVEQIGIPASLFLDAVQKNLMDVPITDAPYCFWGIEHGGHCCYTPDFSGGMGG